MIPLSHETLWRLEALFPGKDRAAAIALLETECAENLSSHNNATPESLDRIRFAALKLSDGNLVRLRREVEEAKKDWRDTLMAAGFGYDVEEHMRWLPEGRRL